MHGGLWRLAQWKRVPVFVHWSILLWIPWYLLLDRPVFWILITFFAVALPVRMPHGTLVSVAFAPIVAAMALGGQIMGVGDNWTRVMVLDRRSGDVFRVRVLDGEKIGKVGYAPSAILTTKD